MANNNNKTVFVHRSNQNKPIAKVTLNGYNIKAGGLSGLIGAMRSFKIEQGDLWDAWNEHAPLTVKDDAGNEANIRIAAYPAEEGATGFVEFL